MSDKKDNVSPPIYGSGDLDRVQCNSCGKWRILLEKKNPHTHPKNWTCDKNHFGCSIPEESCDSFLKWIVGETSKRKASSSINNTRQKKQRTEVKTRTYVSNQRILDITRQFLLNEEFKNLAFDVDPDLNPDLNLEFENGEYVGVIHKEIITKTDKHLQEVLSDNPVKEQQNDKSLPYGFWENLGSIPKTGIFTPSSKRTGRDIDIF